MHRERIKKMQAQIDTTVPTVCNLDHLRNNLKREQLMEERYYNIDRENKILLNKMTDIMRPQTERSDRTKTPPILPTPPSSARQSSGGQGPSSLNRDSRKTELMRITQENQAILKRIQQVQPVYNHVLWEDSYRRSGRYLKNGCEYNVILPVRANSARSGQTPRGRPGSDGGLENRLTYVLKEGRKIGSSDYLVEMATDGRILSISVSQAFQKSKDLVLSEKNHRKLLSNFAPNGDPASIDMSDIAYKLIADQLYVEGDQLRIPGFVSDDATGGIMSSGASNND
jgi:E3 ubiquitin-protein ligase TRIP12